MNILVIDDKREELQRAAAAIEAAGHDAIVTSDSSEAIKLMNQVDAVITDMMFAPSRCGSAQQDYYRSVTPPMGLTMIILAMSHNKPIVACTDSYHHGNEVSFVYDGFISELLDAAELASFREGDKEKGFNHSEWLGVDAPFGWIENKDWEAAVKAVEARLASK